MGMLGMRGGRAIALAAATAAGLAVDATPAGAAPLNLLRCGSDTSFRVVSATSPTPIATCTLDLPQSGRVIMVGSVTTGYASGTTGYAAELDLAIDGATAEAEHFSDFTRPGGVSRIKSAEVQAVRPVRAGAHTFTFTAARSSGDGVYLENPSLAAIFVPDGSAQVQVCESPNDDLFSTATTFTPIATCSLDVAAPSHALILGSAEATLLATTEYEARLRLALDGAPVASTDRYVNVGVGTYDFHESAVAQAVVPVAAGAHGFALGWQRTAGTGTARFAAPSVIALVVPDAPERTHQRLCAAPAVGGWASTASAFGDITACSLPFSELGSALVVGSATATIAGGGSGGAYQGAIALGGTEASSIHSVYVATDAGDGVDRTVVTSTLAEVDAGETPSYTLQGSMEIGTGPATLYRPALSTLFVAAPDTTAPIVTVTPPASPSRDGRATVAFAADELGAHFECAVDAGAFAACASPLTVGPLADGPHRLFVRPIDLVGNVGATADAAWVVELAKGGGAGGGGGGAGSGGGGGGGAAGKPLARGTVSVSWKRVRHGRRVRSLKVVKGAKVTLRCAGGTAKGCPFSKVVLKVRRSGSLSLTARLKRHTLRTGARLSIQVDEPGRAGRRVTYAVRSSGSPKRTITTVK